MSTMKSSMFVISFLMLGSYLPLIVLVNGVNVVAAIQSTNCSEVKCPPLSEIVCPEDSFIRETNEETNVIASQDHYEIVKEVFVQCCVKQKCECRTCHIPSCHNSSLVLYELKPETDIPGKCCGSYECLFEPICSVVTDTDNYWLTDCKRCKCTDGKKECLTVCDESIMQMIPHSLNETDDDSDENMVACFSKKLNQFFMSGEKWMEDNNCTVCECFGEHAKCDEVCNKNITTKTTITTTAAAGTEITDGIRLEMKCISSQLNNTVFSNGEKWKEDNCTNCECVSGVKICHHACENPLIERFSPINCISTYLKSSFGNGEVWYEDDGCSYCKCENGEKHCQTSFCQHTNCIRKIKIPGECCSRCLDENNSTTTTTTTIAPVAIISMATETTTDSNNTSPIIIIDKSVSSETIEYETTEPSIPLVPAESDTSAVTINEKTTTTTQNTIDIPLCPNTIPIQNAIPMYQDQDLQNKLYWAIVVLTVLLVIVSILYLIERRKRSINSRSYDPVSYTDDNSNRISAIKPIKAYTYSYENEKINQNGKEIEKINQNGK